MWLGQLLASLEAYQTHHCTAIWSSIRRQPESLGSSYCKLGSTIYFPNCSYIRERILRWIRDEQASRDADGGSDIEHVFLELGGVTSIDITGIETFIEILKALEAKGIKVALVNPRLEVMEKLIVTKFIDTIGKENVFLSIHDAVEASRFNFRRSKKFEDV